MTPDLEIAPLVTTLGIRIGVETPQETGTLGIAGMETTPGIAIEVGILLGTTTPDTAGIVDLPDAILGPKIGVEVTPEITTHGPKIKASQGIGTRDIRVIGPHPESRELLLFSLQLDPRPTTVTDQIPLTPQHGTG